MRVILAPLGSHGDVHPFVGLGRALKARGHEVLLLTAEPFRELADRAGFDGFAPLGTADDFERMIRDPDLWHPDRAVKAVHGDPARVGRMIRDAYARIAAWHRPGDTAVVAGTLTFGARVAQEKLGVPLATVHLQPCVFYSVDDPPLYANFHIRKWWPRAVKRGVYWMADRLVLDRMLAPPLNAFRGELGLPPVTRVFGRWMDSPELVLGLFPGWFGSAADWPPQTRLPGFVRYDQSDDTPLSPDLDAFLNDGPPPVVFTFGSAMRLGKPFFTAAADACRLLGVRGLLLAKGRDQVPDSLPDGVRHFDYAPFSSVFPRAAAVVHHGGIGTTAQALAAGVPQLIMPLAHDMPDNARRLERLGVGRAVYPKRFRGPAVAAALKELTASPAVAAACRTLAGRMTEGDPAADACRLIEGLIGRGGRAAV